MSELNLTSFLTDFAALPDPRLARRRQYPLLEILFLCVSASLSGYDPGGFGRKIGREMHRPHVERAGGVLRGPHRPAAGIEAGRFGQLQLVPAA